MLLGALLAQWIGISIFPATCRHRAGDSGQPSILWLLRDHFVNNVDADGSGHLSREDLFDHIKESEKTSQWWQFPPKKSNKYPDRFAYIQPATRCFESACSQMLYGALCCSHCRKTWSRTKGLSALKMSNCSERRDRTQVFTKHFDGRVHPLRLYL